MTGSQLLDSVITTIEGWSKQQPDNAFLARDNYPPRWIGKFGQAADVLLDLANQLEVLQDEEGGR